MRLFRYGEPGRERPGIITGDGRALDVSHAVRDYDPETVAALEADPSPLARIDGGDAVDLSQVRFGPPLGRIGMIWCIGLNYVDHAKEAGMAIPSEPVVFAKAASALSGPNDPIPYPPGMTRLDWEVELGVVIGRPAYRIAEAEALDHVFGYVLANDVSERAWQLERGGQWMKGKSHPGFCPIGPWLATRDEIGDPQALSLWLDVNGARKQDGTTAAMIFPVTAIVRYLSHFARLDAGDLILTGTPAGVGSGFKPPVFLSPGDEVRLGVDGLGEQHQRVMAT